MPNWGSPRVTPARLALIAPVPVILGITMLTVIAACTSGPRKEPASGTPASPGASATTPGNITGLASAGLVVPATYVQACANESAICVQGPDGSPPVGSIPAALIRPLRFPSLPSGGRCPASPGRQISTADFGGIALGKGPVRVVIWNRGDLRRGVADLSRQARPHGSRSRPCGSACPRTKVRSSSVRCASATLAPSLSARGRQSRHWLSHLDRP
jgi:hypothetical protein